VVTIVAGAGPGKECVALLGQVDVARLAAFGDRDVDGSGIAIEVADLHRGKFAIPASGQQGGGHQGPKLAGACVDQALRLRLAEISDFGAFVSRKGFTDCQRSGASARRLW